jgi:FlaG/FlaF family flagellin (archaellin)
MQMKHIKRHIRRNVKAISPVLAVLMMIAVAIAGSLVVYAWVMGYIGLSTERSGQAIMIQSIANDVTDTDLLVFVQNVGEGVVQLEEFSCLYINGEIVNCTITGVTVSDYLATLNKGDTATLTYVEGAALPGQKVTAKVTTLLGTSAEAHEYPAGSARVAPALDHFAFSTIASPQVSGVAFSITIEAQDQYDERFDYTSTCDLVYSDGTMVPLVTGAFNHGVWTGEVTVTGAAEDATITATGTIETQYSGISNQFEVDAPVMFVSAGDGGRGGTVVTPLNRRSPTYPPDLEKDDLILLQIGIRDGTNSPDQSQLASAGFTLLYADQSSSTGMGQWIYYKFSVDGSETGSLTIPINGNPTNVVSCMYAFRYVAISNFNEDGSFGTQESDVIYAEDVTTYGSRRLAVSFIYMKGYESTVEEFTGETGGDWIKQAEFQNSISGTYEDAAIQLQTAEMITTGTISGGTCRTDDMISQQEGWGVRAFALIPRD